jgi:hypothetical protein
MIDKFNKSSGPSSSKYKDVNGQKASFKGSGHGLRFETDVQYLKGVGPKLGSLFYRSGIKTVEDLLLNFPRAYEDLSLIHI